MSIRIVGNQNTLYEIERAIKDEVVVHTVINKKIDAGISHSFTYQVVVNPLSEYKSGKQKRRERRRFERRNGNV
jgi:hypothetical protein